MVKPSVDMLLDEIVEVVKSDKSVFRSKHDIAKVLDKITGITEDIRLATDQISGQVMDTTDEPIMDLEPIKQLVQQLDQFRGKTGMREEFRSDFNTILDNLTELLNK